MCNKSNYGTTSYPPNLANCNNFATNASLITVRYVTGLMFAPLLIKIVFHGFPGQFIAKLKPLDKTLIPQF